MIYIQLIIENKNFYFHVHEIQRESLNSFLVIIYNYYLIDFIYFLDI